MTARDGKRDPQDVNAPTARAVSAPHLFPPAPGERLGLQASAVTTMQRIRDLEAQFATISRQKRDEITKLKQRLNAQIEEIESLG